MPEALQPEARLPDEQPEGWLRITPAIALPPSPHGAPPPEVWLKLPESGEVGAAYTPGGRPYLTWPFDTAFEYRTLRPDGGYSRIDGLTITPEGPRYHVLIRLVTGPLYGIHWLANGPEAENAFNLLSYMRSFAVTTTDTPQDFGNIDPTDIMSRSYDCTRCHTPLREDNPHAGAFGVLERGSDAWGLQVVSRALLDQAPLESIGTSEPNLHRPFVQISCPDGSPPLEVENQWHATRLRCSLDATPQATFDVRAARAAGDETAQAVCATRAALAPRLSESAKTIFHDGLAACGLAETEP